jgi:hypothetical protein
VKSGLVRQTGNHGHLLLVIDRTDAMMPKVKNLSRRGSYTAKAVRKSHRKIVHHRRTHRQNS